MLAPDERVQGFSQIELGLTKEDALKEAERCLRCHSEVCVGCAFCARTCPDYIIEVDRTPSGDVDRRVREWNFDISKCMFCGLCVEQCPTDTLRFSEEFELEVLDKNLLFFDKKWMLRNTSSQNPSFGSLESDRE